MPSLFPGSDSKLLEGSVVFDQGLSANYAALGMTGAQAASYGAAHQAFATALAAATTPATRTSITVGVKDDARTALKALAGEYAKMTGANPGVTNAQREALGLTVRTVPRPVPSPGVSPVMEVLGVVGWRVSIKLKSTKASERGRPAGMASAVVFSYVGPTPPSDIEKWVYQGSTSKLLTDVQFPANLPGGTTVWLTAQWLNAKSESGPAAFPISTTLQGGNVVQMAA